MIHAVDLTDGSLSASLSELEAVLSLAYEQVKLARRYAASVPASSDLATRLQSAEAELVRARVALTLLNRSTGNIIPFDPLAVVERESSVIIR